MTPPEVCPNCGAEVPRNARACPECGADEQTGWAEEAIELGLPNTEFNYDRFVQEEFGTDKVKPRGLPWLWWVVGIVLLAVLLLWWLS